MPIEIRPFTKEDRDGSGDQDLTARATWFLVQHMSCSRPIAASSLPTPDAIVGTIKLTYAMPHGGGSDDPVRKAKSFICSLSNTDESILFSPGEKNLSDPVYLLWYSAHRHRIEVGGPPSLDMEDGTIDTLAEYEGEPSLDNNDGGDLDTPMREATNMSPSGSSSVSASSSRSSSAPASSTLRHLQQRHRRPHRRVAANTHKSMQRPMVPAHFMTTSTALCPSIWAASTKRCPRRPSSSP